MNIDPNAFSKNLLGHLVGVNILKVFWACRMSPETITAPMRMFLEGSSTNGELRDILNSLSFFNAENLVWLVEIMKELLT